MIYNIIPKGITDRAYASYQHEILLLIALREKGFSVYYHLLIISIFSLYSIDKEEYPNLYAYI